MPEFARHRQALLNQLAPNSIAIIQATKLQYRNGHTEYAFRQDSNFYYITGLCEPNAVCVLLKGKNKNAHKFILFLAPKTRDAEIWTGTRTGQNNAQSVYHADTAYDIAQAGEIIPQLLKNQQAIYYLLGQDYKFDKKIISWLNLATNKITRKARALGENVTCTPNTLHNISPILSELRLFKTEQEINTIRRATQISCQGHLQLMQLCAPGLYEYQLEAEFTRHCLQQGCRALAYPMIVAGGDDACILHYIQNDKQLAADKLVVIDAGCEYQYYASDLTRTIPVNGKFNNCQKIIYNLVLQAQLAGLQAIKPGNKFSMVQEVIVKTLVTGLVAHGLLIGELTQLIQTKSYKKFYMHNASHWLGLDVHDVGDYYIAGDHRTFEPGMVFTVEPGLYIAADEIGVAAQWRGIGVRIEDMVLVTADGHEVLSHNLPKTIAEIEAIMAKK